MRDYLDIGNFKFGTLFGLYAALLIVITFSGCGSDHTGVPIVEDMDIYVISEEVVVHATRKIPGGWQGVELRLSKGTEIRTLSIPAPEEVEEPEDPEEPIMPRRLIKGGFGSQSISKF